MQYEVEQKFPIDDLGSIAVRLDRLGASFGEPMRQRDRYFAHPARDFAVSDEALRIRSVGNENCITYKGPKIDNVTKTRREIELPLVAGPDQADAYAELLVALGFTAVSEVNKERRTANLVWQTMQVEIALDVVDRLGTFVELEISSDEEWLDRARQCLQDLAAHLELSQPERRGYLQLLLDDQPGV